MARKSGGMGGRLLQKGLMTIAVLALVGAFAVDRLNVDLGTLTRGLNLGEVTKLLESSVERATRQQGARPAGQGAPPTAFDGADEITIASWNVRVLSDGSRDDDEVAKIAEAISQFDIVAVQESRDTRVLDRVLDLLPGWTYVSSDPVGRGVTELYAFFWRESRARLIGRPSIVGDPQDRFIREPYAATFRAGDFDFTLCTIHVLFGDSKGERRRELVLMDDVVDAVQAANGAEQDVILLGDFNFPPTDRGWQLDGWKSLFMPPLKTTIGDKSLYDNIWIHPRYTREYKGQRDMVRFDREQYDGNLRNASREMSDHRPIWAAFGTGNDDDPDDYGDLSTAVVGARSSSLP